MARAVLVTGASSGIGQASALRLAASGWRVFGGVRSEEDAERLREHGVEPLQLDVTDSATIAAAAEVVGGELHGLVDNAGIAIAAPLELVPLDELRRQLEVNVVGQVAVLQAFLPLLRRSQGRVVLMGSVGGRSALPFLGPYAASKHALEAIADSLRVELAPWGIGVSIVEPASVKTAIWTKGAAQADVMRAGISHDRNELYAARIERFRAVALKRGPGIDPDVVARAVEHALTASRPKARYLVGRDAHIRAWIERLPTRLRDRRARESPDRVSAITTAPRLRSSRLQGSMRDRNPRFSGFRSCAYVSWTPQPSHSWPKRRISWTTGSKARPFAVSAYSTRGGDSG